MGSVRLWHRFEYEGEDVYGNRIRFAVPGDHLDLSELIDGRVSKQTFELDPAEIMVLWAAATDALESFEVLCVVSDVDGVEVQLTTDAGGGGEENYVVTVGAERPLILHSDDGIGGLTPDTFAGAAAKIEELRARNNNGTETANLTVFMVT